MAANSQSVVIQRSMNFWNNIPGSAGNKPLPRWKKRKRLCWLALRNEDPHRRVPPSGAERNAHRDGPRVRNSAESRIRLQEER